MMVVMKSRKPQLRKSLGISEMNSDASLMHHLLLLGQWTLMSSAFSSYLLVHELSSRHRGGEETMMFLNYLSSSGSRFCSVDKWWLDPGFLVPRCQPQEKPYYSALLECCYINHVWQDIFSMFVWPSWKCLVEPVSRSLVQDIIHLVCLTRFREQKNIVCMVSGLNSP